MAFADHADQPSTVDILQRSLRRGRLAHAYLFAGPELDTLVKVSRTLAKVINCDQPVADRSDSCDRCDPCTRIESDNHPDVLWVRPESKLRVITIDQVRELTRFISLKPAAGRWKVGIVEGADRLNPQAANAFLKTLEEPPANSIFILLSTQPHRLLETVLSRCLRLHFAAGGRPFLVPEQKEWLTEFAEAVAADAAGLLARYRLLGRLVERLAAIKTEIEAGLRSQAPLDRYSDADPEWREKIEDELVAATESEYRRQRGELIVGLELLFRDVLVQSHRLSPDLLLLPDLKEWTARLGSRLRPEDALQNLKTVVRTHRMLETTVQEALVLEVGLLSLRT